MDGFLESLQVEFIVALVFAILGVVTSKLLTPVISHLVYRHTRKYPSRRLDKFTRSFGKLSATLKDLFWYKNHNAFKSIEHKYNIYIEGDKIICKRSDVYFLRLNALNNVVGEVENSEAKNGLHKAKNLDLIGFFKDYGDEKILFLEEAHSNFPALHYEKCQYTLLPKPAFFGKGMKYSDEKKGMVTFYSLLSSEFCNDFYEILDRHDLKFDEKIFESVTQRNQVKII